MELVEGHTRFVSRTPNRALYLNRIPTIHPERFTSTTQRRSLLPNFIRVQPLLLAAPQLTAPFSDFHNIPGLLHEIPHQLWWNATWIVKLWRNQIYAPKGRHLIRHLWYATTVFLNLFTSIHCNQRNSVLSLLRLSGHFISLHFINNTFRSSNCNRASERRWP